MRKGRRLENWLTFSNGLERTKIFKKRSTIKMKAHFLISLIILRFATIIRNKKETTIPIFGIHGCSTFTLRPITLVFAYSSNRRRQKQGFLSFLDYVAE